ncbi:MAG: hypothetical protein K9M45_00035 [Kiritimatiellales bacterium]|nr:hypothetical protein [Kiritimatiellales bacterium]
MNRNLYNVFKFVRLMLVLASMACWASAREETPEERKKRIARRYLREHGAIAGSVAEVPMESAEIDEALNAKSAMKLKEITKVQSATLPPPQLVRRPPAKKEDMSWLLEPEPEVEEGARADQNPYDWFANELQQQQGKQYEDFGQPKTGYDFSRSASERETERLEVIKDPRALDYGTQQQGQKKGYTRPESAFSFSSGRTSRKDDGRPVYYNGKELQEQPAYGSSYRSGSSYKSSAAGIAATDPLPLGSGNAVRREPKYRIYQKDTVRQPYQPLPSPGEDRRKQEEYKRVSPYEQWKKSSAEDPMKDNSFIDGVMPKINNNR